MFVKHILVFKNSDCNNKRESSQEETVDKHILEREIVDSVWLMKEYRPQTFSIEEAIGFHKELACPEMFNNLDGFLNVRLTLDMTTKKKVGSIDFPHICLANS